MSRVKKQVVRFCGFGLMVQLCILGQIAAFGKRMPLTAKDAIQAGIIMHDKDIAYKIFGDLGTFSGLSVPGYPETYQLHERFIPVVVHIENKTKETVILPVPYIIREFNEAIIPATFLRDVVKGKQTLFPALLKTAVTLPVNFALGYISRSCMDGLMSPNKGLDEKAVRTSVLALDAAIAATMVMFLKKTWKNFGEQGRLIEKLNAIGWEQGEGPRKLLPGESYQTTILIDSYRVEESLLMKNSYTLVYKLWGH